MSLWVSVEEVKALTDDLFHEVMAVDALWELLQDESRELKACGSASDSKRLIFLVHLDKSLRVTLGL